MLTAIHNRLGNRLTSAFAVTALGLSAFVASPSVQAGDFQPKRVAADAKWLAFIDVEGMLNSTLGKFVLEHGGEFDIDIEGISAMKEEIGLDPLKDIRSVTIYGEGNPEAHQHFVAVLETSAAVDDAVAHFTGGAADAGDEGDDIAQVEINGQKVHVLSDGNHTTYLQVRGGPTSADRVVVLSMDREWMAKGLGVLEGKVASLEGAAKSAVSGRIANGTLAFARCGDLGWLVEAHGDNHEPASAIVKAARGVEFAYGETGPDTFISARLETGSAEDAQNISDIMRGLVAMARFAGRNEPELAPLLEPLKSLQLKSDGAMIEVSLKHNTEGLIQTLGAMAAAGEDDEINEDEDEDDGDETVVEIKTGVDVKKPVKKTEKEDGQDE